MQFRTAIATKLAIIKAVSPPRTANKAGNSLLSLGSSTNTYGDTTTTSARTLFPTTSNSSKNIIDSDDDSSIDSDIPIVQQLAQRQAKYLAKQQQQQQQTTTLSSSSLSITTPGKHTSKNRYPSSQNTEAIIDILDTDEEITLSQQTNNTIHHHHPNTTDTEDITQTQNEDNTSSTANAGSSGSKGSVKLASSLPLILPKQPKRNRSTMLVQIEDNNLELSGDIGAIGRLTTLPNEGIILDLKGHQYGGNIIPCGSFMVVGFQPKEARVETIISDFVQVEHLANMIDNLSGSLTSGTIDPVLLQFQDVDGDETAALAKKYSNNDDENEEEETTTVGKKKQGSSGKRKRSSDNEDDSDDDYDMNDNDDDDSEDGGKRKSKGAADKNPSIKIYGRAVKVGKKKKSKKKAAGKTSRKKAK